MKARAFARLDQYMNGGSSEALLEKSLREPREYSIREGKCLMHGKKATNGHDKDEINVQCDDCHKRHRWGIQRGHLDACHIGRFPGTLLENILKTEDASYTCHNPMCSDPFHIEKESVGYNIQRNACVERYKRGVFQVNCGHKLRCRFELIAMKYEKGI